MAVRERGEGIPEKFVGMSVGQLLRSADTAQRSWLEDFVDQLDFWQ